MCNHDGFPGIGKIYRARGFRDSPPLSYEYRCKPEFLTTEYTDEHKVVIWRKFAET